MKHLSKPCTKVVELNKAKVVLTLEIESGTFTSGRESFQQGALVLSENAISE